MTGDTIVQVTSLPKFTEPGCYSLVYFDHHGRPLCAKCAQEYQLLNEVTPEAHIHWEGAPIECSACYGDPVTQVTNESEVTK